MGGGVGFGGGYRPRFSHFGPAAPRQKSGATGAGGQFWTRPRGDRVGGDRAGVDRAGVDRAGGDRAGGDRAGVYRVGVAVVLLLCSAH